MIVNKYPFDDNNKTLSRPWKIKCSFKILLLIFLFNSLFQVDKTLLLYKYANPNNNTTILFGATHGWEQKGLLIKICHTYHTIMKFAVVIPYLKKIQKIYKSRDTPLAFC